MVGQAVGFLILLAWYVRDAKLQGMGQLAAHPVERIKPRAAAGIFAGHLLHHQLGIGVNTQRRGFQIQGALQGFQQGGIFGHIIVVMANPLGYPDQFSIRLFNQNANAGWPRTAVGATVDVSDEICHLPL